MRSWAFALLNCRRLAWAAVMLAGGVSAAAESPPTPTVRRDCYGDPLPPGALARMGSIRLRHNGGITSAAFSPDGTVLAAASAGNTEHSVRLWDVKTGRELRRLPDERTPWIDRIAFSPDGKLLAGLSGPDNSIYLWDVASGASRGVVVRHKKSISTFAFSPDGKKIAAAGECVVGGTDFKIYLWSLETGERLRVFDGHRAAVHDLAFTRDGQTLFSASLAQRARRGEGKPPLPAEVCAWDVAGGKLRHRYPPKNHHRFAPNGATFFFFDDKDKLHVCDASTGRELWSTTADWTQCVYSPDGKFLVAGQREQPCRLWEAATGKEVRRFPNAVSQSSLCFHCLSADRTTLATEGGLGGIICLWDTTTGREHRPFGGHHDAVTCLDFSADARTLISGSVDGTLRLWETATGKELRTFQGSEQVIRSVSFADDGRRIASGESQNVVRLWDTATAAELWHFRGPVPPLRVGADGMLSLGFRREGRDFVAASGDGTIRIWDVAAGKPRRQLGNPCRRACAMALSPDGRFASSGEAPELLEGHWTLRIWDLKTERELHSLRFPDTERLGDAAFSPDGKLLVCARYLFDHFHGFNYGHKIQVWETATGKLIRRIDGTGLSGGFAPDGSVLVADNAMLDPVSGVRLGEKGERLDGDGVRAFSRDGRLLAVGGDDGTILIYPMPRRARPKAGSRHALSEADLQKAWSNLASAEATTGWAAVQALRDDPARSVPFLQTVLRPHRLLDRGLLDRLLVDLDSEQFTVREQARKGLSQFGELAEPALRRRLEGKPSLEVRRQLLGLLERIANEARSPESLRVLRVTAVLERIGSPESVELLRRLAGGAVEARLTREAAAALKRRTGQTARP